MKISYATVMTRSPNKVVPASLRELDLNSYELIDSVILFGEGCNPSSANKKLKKTLSSCYPVPDTGSSPFAGYPLPQA